MAFGGRPAGGGSGGVELARGYISLTAKYSPAMAQIANDFKALEREAEVAGVAAGAKLKAGMVGGPVPLGTALRQEFAKSGRVMASDAEAYGTLIGGVLGRGIAAPFKAVDKVVGSVGKGIQNTVTGPMAKMIGGATLLGVAFETLGKGWQLDVKLDATRTQIEALGGSAQDVQTFMEDLRKATDGTANSMGQVADAAKDLFAEGVKGDALVDELKTVQNMAAIAGKSVESIWGVMEKAHGRGAINPMVLGSLQMQGVPAREELAKALNLRGTADEIDDQLNAALTDKKHPIKWEELFEQFGKDFPDAAAKFSHSLQGQMQTLQKNLGNVGGDFIKGALGGGTGGLEGINNQLEKLDTWINSHQDEIHHFFDQLASAARDIGSALAEVKGWIDQIPGGIKTVIEVWAGWKVLSMVGDLGKVTGATKLLELAVEGVSFGAWLGPIGALLAGLGAALGLVKLVDAAVSGSRFDLTRGPTLSPDQIAKGQAPPMVTHPLGGPTMSSSPLPDMAGLASLAAGGDKQALSALESMAGKGDKTAQNLLKTVPHANGYLPKQAGIQSSVGPKGLVQWAEPSTHGEAFIPLAPGKRSKSLSIWAETGKRLGAAGFDDGGFTGPDVAAASSLAGTPYSMGNRTDCSGDVGRVINSAMGLGNDSLPTTANMGEWLKARGFHNGVGGLGDITVGWYNGYGPGGGHAAMTLSDGSFAEGGGASGAFAVGGKATGATSSQFTNHMFIKASAIRGEGDKYGGTSLDTGGGSPSGGGGAGGRSGGGGSGGDPLSQLAGIVAGGAKESLLPPGFTDYTQNPWVKSAGAALGMLGGAVGGPGGGLLGLFGGLLGGGSVGGGGILPAGLGDALMHPARAALAGANPQRAQELGWVGQGNPASLARSSTGHPLAAGLLGPGEKHGGGNTFNVNGGAMISASAADQLNKMAADKAITDTRAKHSSTSSVSRIGMNGTSP
jgi:cell wall-associated NlpC family hydrolase